MHTHTMTKPSSTNVSPLIQPSHWHRFTLFTDHSLICVYRFAVGWVASSAALLLSLNVLKIPKLYYSYCTISHCCKSSKFISLPSVITLCIAPATATAACHVMLLIFVTKFPSVMWSSSSSSLLITGSIPLVIDNWEDPFHYQLLLLLCFCCQAVQIKHLYTFTHIAAFCLLGVLCL